MKRNEWTMALKINDDRVVPLPLDVPDNLVYHLGGFVNNYVSNGRDRDRINLSTLQKSTDIATVFAGLFLKMEQKFKIKILGNPKIVFIKNFVFYDTIILMERTKGLYTLGLKDVVYSNTVKEQFPGIYDYYNNLKVNFLKIVAEMVPDNTYRVWEKSAFSGNLYLQNGIHLDVYEEVDDDD